jgi:hypothetical protein
LIARYPNADQPSLPQSKHDALPHLRILKGEILNLACPMLNKQLSSDFP